MAKAKQCPSGHWLRADGRCTYCEKKVRDAQKTPALGTSLPSSPFAPLPNRLNTPSASAASFAEQSARFDSLNIGGQTITAPPLPSRPVTQNTSSPRTTFDLALNEIDSFERTTRQPVQVTLPGGETQVAPFDQAAAAVHLRKVATLVALPERYKDESFSASEVYSPGLREEAHRFTGVTSVAFDPANPSLPHQDYRAFLAKVRQEQERHSGLTAVRQAQAPIFA